MRHPLTGGGMTVALNDVVLLQDLLSPLRVPNLEDTRLVLHQLKIFHWKRTRFSAVINILAQALYSLFDADDRHLVALRNGCFAYFQLGGDCVQKPAELLAGIAQNPHVLMYHFTAVACLSVWIMLSSQPIWRLPLTLLDSFLTLYKAAAVVVPLILAEIW